jgi:hypothetical protein
MRDICCMIKVLQLISIKHCFHITKPLSHRCSLNYVSECAHGIYVKSLVMKLKPLHLFWLLSWSSVVICPYLVRLASTAIHMTHILRIRCLVYLGNCIHLYLGTFLMLFLHVFVKFSHRHKIHKQIVISECSLYN